MKKNVEKVERLQCDEQKQRTIGLDTYQPCNNCIYYAWDFQGNQYICKHPNAKFCRHPY